jgi:hypothetical protein
LIDEVNAALAMLRPIKSFGERKPNEKVETADKPFSPETESRPDPSPGCVNSDDLNYLNVLTANYALANYELANLCQ